MENIENKAKLLLENVSNERKRLSSDRMDISFGELINLYKNKELVIRPEYQRLFRWSSKQKTALIESHRWCELLARTYFYSECDLKSRSE